MNKILHLVGARPNFMKLAPVYRALSTYSNVDQIIVHTGQHYSKNMSDIFFEQLQLPVPDYNMDVSGGSVISQIGNGLLKIEAIIKNLNPKIICLYGDINATAFGSIAASKLSIPIAHIEAGLRSFDLTMPEETNRIITDALSSYFFTPSIDASQNLLKEGKSKENIHFVGNVMIDTLIYSKSNIEEADISFDISLPYVLVTLHRPSNVDDISNIKKIIDTLCDLSKKYHIIFPVHPRTRNMINLLHISNLNNISLIDPLDYFSFLKIQKYAKFVITDSGGVQEETTYLNVPCFTLRNNTERPITITQGTNMLIGTDLRFLLKQIEICEIDGFKQGNIPELWDGKSGDRIAKSLDCIL